MKTKLSTLRMNWRTRGASSSFSYSLALRTAQLTLNPHLCILSRTMVQTLMRSAGLTLSSSCVCSRPELRSDGSNEHVPFSRWYLSPFGWRYVCCRYDIEGGTSRKTHSDISRRALCVGKASLPLCTLVSIRAHMFEQVYRNHRKRHSPDTSTAHRVCPVVQLPACVPAYADVVYLLLSKKDAAPPSQRSVAAPQTRVFAVGGGAAAGGHVVAEDRTRDDHGGGYHAAEYPSDENGQQNRPNITKVANTAPHDEKRRTEGPKICHPHRMDAASHPHWTAVNRYCRGYDFSRWIQPLDYHWNVRANA